jgi:hypothetical protein
MEFTADNYIKKIQNDRIILINDNENKLFLKIS